MCRAIKFVNADNSIYWLSLWVVVKTDSGQLMWWLHKTTVIEFILSKKSKAMGLGISVVREVKMGQ